MIKFFVSVLSIASFLGVSAPLHADEMDDWRGTVIQSLISNKIYPRSAIEKEIEGRALVLLTVNSADGEIVSYDILQPTGQLILDREIPKIILRTKELPTPPTDETITTLVVPLIWTLN